MAAIEAKKGINEEQQQELDDVFERAHKALAIIETYDQARVDRLCQAVAWAVANKKTFTRLVDMGIKESGLGDAVSRMGKRMKIRGVLRDALRQKSVGIIEELPEKGIVKYGKPAGIIACIVPTTNPDLTPAGNAIYGIKARDVVIFSPHPRSKKTSFETVRLMREALEKEGAPADILQCLTKVNIPMSQALMARADLIVATGGQPMVRAAYSSGTPAYGVGAGNSTMIIDETANIEEAARNTRLSKTSDFGSGCSADGNLIIEASIFDKLLAQLQKEGGYLASPQEKEQLRRAMWDDERHRTVETVAIAPQQLAKAAGFEIPADRKFIIVHGDGIGKEHHYSGEKLTTLLAVYKYKGFDQALDMMRAVYEVGGKGHSCGIYSFDQDHIHRAGDGGAGVPDHGAPAAVEGERRRVQQRDADDLEPRLRHLGRQRHLRERAPQALPQHDVGVGADQGRQALRRGAVRPVLRRRDGSRGRDHHDLTRCTAALRRPHGLEGAAMKATIAEQLVKYLEARGVKHIFGLCGHTNIAVLSALSKSKKIKFINTRHEQIAAHAADGYARATNKTSVVLSHLSPGLTNAATGVANAALDSIPMVVIAGDVPSHYYGKHPHQEVNLHADASQYEIYRPFVKRAWRVDSPHLFPEIIEKAFALAESGRPGPVLVDVPMDIFSKEIDGALWKRVLANTKTLHKPSLDDETAESIVRALLAAKTPLLYVGGGILIADAARRCASWPSTCRCPSRTR